MSAAIAEVEENKPIVAAQIAAAVWVLSFLKKGDVVMDTSI
jgi:hypothetical protein